ncbi:AAA family ATPase [Rhizobium ruizarguesonis]|uniref:McrB family protein n=1 Tax=Rhizobium TaxID=379 RepID=UPI000FEC98FC|nr:MULTISPECIES: AAA family ATPase [Rhizobium]RWX05689.1 AAA family ATPase [Rhizobium leguminosarum]TAU03612.1 AAA family ATPase [Rhizobium ruizarguesonis]
MSTRIRADRVALALHNISDWKEQVRAQSTAHLMPLLALLEKGAGKEEAGSILFRETPDEFAFWDRYFHLNDGDKLKPYFNPITLRRAEAGFPHSNAATIRKNTFEGKWKGAVRTISTEGENWELSGAYADVFRTNVLTKSGQVSRVPVVDLAAMLFRAEVFDDADDARALERRFRERFPQQDVDYEKLFVFVSEDRDRVFVSDADPQDYEAAIKSALVEDVKTAAAIPHAAPPPVSLDLSDPILLQVQQLLTFGSSGIILTGAPGTGKSYYAKRIATHLVKSPKTDIFRVQFHPSYGYEDFVEGYRPAETAVSGYKIVDKTFIDACERARAVQAENGLVVLIVDEINRGDPARVFGELLTYIERNYRDDPFILPFSGREFTIPNNLVLIGTMNPFDRSISQVDAAFVRRFDHIEVSPSRDVVEGLLDAGRGFSTDQLTEIGAWFDTIQKMVPFGLGHSFFADVKNLDHLKLVWRYRMKPAAELAIDLNDGARGDVIASFDALVKRLEGAAVDA